MKIFYCFTTYFILKCKSDFHEFSSESDLHLKLKYVFKAVKSSILIMHIIEITSSLSNNGENTLDSHCLIQ